MTAISAKVRLLEKENEDLKDEMERMKQIYGNDYKPIHCQKCIHFKKQQDINFITELLKKAPPDKVREILIFIRNYNAGHCKEG